MNDIPWNKIILAEFRSLAILTDEEDKILTYWSRGKSQVEIGSLCGMDERTVRSYIRRLRDLYDQVQPFTPLLPPRK